MTGRERAKGGREGGRIRVANVKVETSKGWSMLRSGGSIGNTD